MAVKFYIQLFLIILLNPMGLYEFPVDAMDETHETENGLNLLWEPGQEVWIKFIDGSSYQHEKVKSISRTWTYHANLKFVFKSYGFAHIRIKFDQDDGHWSQLGRRSTKDKSKPSMNIALNRNNSSTEWRRVVLHEFGHALGLIHEHQNPCDNPIIFTSYNDVIEHYRKYQGWDAETTRRNVWGKRYNTSYCWPFDPKSIMLYAIPQKIRRDKTELIRNTELSYADKAFIRVLYPW